VSRHLADAFESYALCQGKRSESVPGKVRGYVFGYAAFFGNLFQKQYVIAILRYGQNLVVGQEVFVLGHNHLGNFQKRDMVFGFCLLPFALYPHFAVEGLLYFFVCQIENINVRQSYETAKNKDIAGFFLLLFSGTEIDKRFQFRLRQILPVHFLKLNAFCKWIAHYQFLIVSNTDDVPEALMRVLEEKS
jgi:hypothetical protein